MGSYTTKRSRKSYSSNEIDARMKFVNFGILNVIGMDIGVQEHWNLLENTIVNIADLGAPLIEVDQCKNVAKQNTLPAVVKSKINLKKRLFRTYLFG